MTVGCGAGWVETEPVLGVLGAAGPSESPFVRPATSGAVVVVVLGVVVLGVVVVAAEVATGVAGAALVGVVAALANPPEATAASVVAQERGLSNITFEPADAESLPFPDADFDLVMCRIAAHHFSDPGQAMREMARVCKPGGRVGLIDPIVPSARKLADEINAWELLRDPSTVSVLTVNGWSSLFCAAGLDAVHINTFEIPLDFDDLLARSSRAAETNARLRAGLLGGSDGMREWLKPEMKSGPKAIRQRVSRNSPASPVWMVYILECYLNLKNI